jgi:hypothetical protein
MCSFSPSRILLAERSFLDEDIYANQTGEKPQDEALRGHDGEARQCQDGRNECHHVAQMSHPKERAKLIKEAATSAHVNQ